MLEQDYPFTCPHCGVDLSARLDVNGGQEQSYVQDCEICCKSIQIEVRFDGDEVEYFSAQAEE